MPAPVTPREVRVLVYAKGPFKGRRYVINADGRRGRRVKPDATKEDIAKHLSEHGPRATD